MRVFPPINRRFGSVGRSRYSMIFVFNAKQTLRNSEYIFFWFYENYIRFTFKNISSNSISMWKIFMLLHFVTLRRKGTCFITFRMLMLCQIYLIGSHWSSIVAYIASKRFKYRILNILKLSFLKYVNYLIVRDFFLLFCGANVVFWNDCYNPNKRNLIPKFVDSFSTHFLQKIKRKILKVKTGVTFTISKKKVCFYNIKKK